MSVARMGSANGLAGVLAAGAALLLAGRAAGSEGAVQEGKSPGSGSAPSRIRPASRGPRRGRPAATVADPDVAHEIEILLARRPRRRTAPRSWKGPRRQGTAFLVAYRLAQFDCVTRACWYHQFDLVFYPVALSEPSSPVWKLVRFGIGIEGGGEMTQQPEHWWQRHQHLGGLLSLGVQYPWRLTPFADFVVTVGAVHRNVYNKEMFQLAYSFGLEVGASLFVVGRLNIVGSVGWRRWVLDTEAAKLHYDDVTATVGFGF